MWTPSGREADGVYVRLEEVMMVGPAMVLEQRPSMNRCTASGPGTPDSSVKE